MRPRVRRAMIRAQTKTKQQQEGTSDTRKGRKKEEKFQIDCDSLILVNMLLVKCSCAWPYLSSLSQIKELLRGVDFQIRQVYREANGVADGLANQAVRTKNSSMFHGALCAFQ
ncbi:unnamed protein product [Ilex paraguariensis]